MAEFKLFTYDVWGNADDGYEVNNVFSTSQVYDIPEDATDNDIRTIMEFNCEIETDGDEDTIYINRSSDGKPLCELRR